MKRLAHNFLMKFLVSAFIDIVLKYAEEISEKSLDQKSLTKSRSKFSFEIVLEFKTQLLRGRTSYQFEVSRQVNLVLLILISLQKLFATTSTQTFASFSASRITNFASAAIRPTSVRTLSIDITDRKGSSAFVDI